MFQAWVSSEDLVNQILGEILFYVKPKDKSKFSWILQVVGVIIIDAMHPKAECSIMSISSIRKQNFICKHWIPKFHKHISNVWNWTLKFSVKEIMGSREVASSSFWLGEGANIPGSSKE